MGSLAGWCARHRKLLAGLGGVLAAFAVQQGWDTNAYVALAIALATVGFGVWRAPNRPAPGPPGNPPPPPPSHLDTSR